MTWTITPAHSAARTAAVLQATLDLASAGGGASTIKLYGPESGGSRPLLGTITLDDPPGAIVGTQIVLAQADAGDTVAATGIPEVADWCDGDGDAIASCSVGPSGSGADLVITSRPDGMVFEGGMLVLTSGAVG